MEHAKPGTAMGTWEEGGIWKANTEAGWTMPNIVTNLYIAVLITVRRAIFLRNILQCSIVLRETYSTVRYIVPYFSVKI